jgi:hypothetical protein
MKIRELQPSEISEAANLLSRGMNDNPINVAAFGSDAGRRQAALARFFRAALVADFCARVDAAGSIAYLETDKKENVPFYEKFGFVVTTESSVLGVPNWFMTRKAG